MANLMRIRNKEKLEIKLSKFVPFFRTHPLVLTNVKALLEEREREGKHTEKKTIKGERGGR